MGLGDEADQARPRQQAEDAAEAEQRGQNWAAINSLVEEYSPGRSQTVAQGNTIRMR